MGPFRKSANSPARSSPWLFFGLALGMIGIFFVVTLGLLTLGGGR